MHIEDRLQSIEAKLDFLVKSVNVIPADESGIAGAGAEPVVAQQVGAAIAAATPAAPARGRGRPKKTDQPLAALPEAADPFAIGEAAPVVTAQPRSLEEVRAAFAVYQAQNNQPAALKLFKDTAGVDTMAALLKLPNVQEIYGKVFKAAIPADKLLLTDVRVVLVKANERKANEGFAVLKKFVPSGQITDLTEAQFVQVILAAHAVV
ncbi:MAG: hypothetical protein ACREXP_00530 [Steroidobacteraceae bacterium]